MDPPNDRRGGGGDDVTLATADVLSNIIVAMYKLELNHSELYTYTHPLAFA